MKQDNNITASYVSLNTPVYCHGKCCSRKDRCVNHRVQSGAQIIDYSTQGFTTSRYTPDEGLVIETDFYCGDNAKWHSCFKEHEEEAVRRVYCCFPVGAVIYDDAGSPWQIEAVSIDEDIWYSIVLVDDLKRESAYQRHVLLLDKDIDGKHWFAYDPTIFCKNA